MYIAGIMDHFSDAPRMELIIWSFTLGITALSGYRARNQVKNSKAGGIKSGSTGPRFWINLALLGQGFGSFVPPLTYWIVTAYNKFQQPEWMAKYALPSPPDVFGVDGVTIGRMVGLLAYLAGTIFARTALKILGDQYQPIGVSDHIFAWITDANRWLTFVPGGR